MKKGQLITEGKTKSIYAVEGNGELVIVSSKDDITAFDDASYTKQFASKGEYATTTTCRIFELLQQAGIPVAYKHQLSTHEFVAKKCDMIPLEVVARRLAVGSYLKRHPELKTKITPHRFHRLEIEFFLKTTGGNLINNQGQAIVKGLIQKIDGKVKTLDDPLIDDHRSHNWELYHPKLPKWEKHANLGSLVNRADVVSQGIIRLEQMEDITRKVFLLCEGAWNTLGIRIFDFKIEFGITTDNKLVVSDVIDNDSWRIRTFDWEDLSKQSFRDGEDLSVVEKKYGTVARLATNIRVPKQALVLWRGSGKDDWPKIGSDLEKAVYKIEHVTLSGHKSPVIAINKLEELMAKYPDGGVIVAKVGRSNGLGPILSARTSWPVIAIPATMEKSPEDIWSSLRMPSAVPLSTAWPESNAIGQAMNILAQKNPVIYMLTQFELEQFDN